MFCCNLCGSQTDEYVFNNLCSKCEQIKKIIELYEVDKVLTSLRFIYLRDEYDKVTNREKAECEKKDQVMELRTRKK